MSNVQRQQQQQMGSPTMTGGGAGEVTSSSAMRLRLKRYDDSLVSGFGFGLEIRDRGSSPVLQIASLANGCEAQKSGLVRPGDIILRINNVDVSRCTYDEALQTLASTPIGSFASFIVRAPFGFATRLVTTFDEDGTPRTLRITERETRKASVTSASLPIITYQNHNLNQHHPKMVVVSNGPSTNQCASCQKISNGTIMVDNAMSPSAGLQPTAAAAVTTQRRHSITSLKPIKLRNVSSNQVTFDVLHHSSKQPSLCSESICLGSLMKTTKEFFHQNSSQPSNSTLMQASLSTSSPSGAECGTQGRSKEQLLTEAYQFMEQYYASVKRLHTPAHRARLREIESEVNDNGTYELRQTELIFGAKLAWRNASRCIGRIQWSKLQVFDARTANTARDMFEAICNQIKYATNRGNLRSAITVMPKRINGRDDFRIWNQQLVSYAGYMDAENGVASANDLATSGTESMCPVLGDPINVEFTKICQKLGWKGTGSRWDILPIVISVPGEDPQLFPLPEDLIIRVPILHPKYEWFEKLELQWYALPAVSSMKFDVGGIEFPACPFSGWYMDTEIAVRDLCDPHRYNLLPLVGRHMGLDTNSNVSLWKDRVVLEITTAVLYSYQKANVTIVDHHTAAESFMKHLENESRLRGGCPADWVWIVPPMSGSLTPVFHQEMLNYELKPAYRYQEPAWKTHVWKNGNLDARNSIGGGGTPRKLRFKEIAKAVKFTSNLFGKALSKRIKATILYATETGRSELFAKRLTQIFSHAFNVSVSCMDAYDMLHLEHEALLLIVTSTFGNGDPPENGEALAKQLQAIRMTGEPTPDLDRESISVPVTYHYSSEQQQQQQPQQQQQQQPQLQQQSSLQSKQQLQRQQQYGRQNGKDRGQRELSVDEQRGANNEKSPASPVPLQDSDSFAFADHVGPLSNVRFGVFALGSSAYPNFCAYGKFLDSVLAELGGERMTRLGTGDELCGQEQSFNEWAAQVFEQACDVFCLTDDLDMNDVMKRATLKPLLWSPENVRLDEWPAATAIVATDAKDTYEYESEQQTTKRIEQALSKLSNNKKVMHYRLLEREFLHEFGDQSSKEANLRQTIRVSLQTDLDQCGDEEKDDDRSAAYYLPGDHLAVYPENEAPLVNALIDRIGKSYPIEADKLYLVKIRSPDNGMANGNNHNNNNDNDKLWNLHDRLPAPVSLREALTRYLDITTPPTQQFLTILADTTESKKHSEQLKHLAKDSGAYEAWKAKRFPNLLEVFLEFSSVKPTLQLIFTQLPLLQPRYYSISSSPLSNSANRLDLTVAVVQYVTLSGSPHNGVCSNFLKNIAVGQNVYGFIRSAPNFRLPKERGVPIIMVGPGTGIAPFRAFWEHRDKMRELNQAEYGKMMLFFGCRYPSMQLYRREIEMMLDEGVINDYHVAYSRKPGEPKKYVQDNMRTASKQIYQTLMHQEGHIYVCGDVSMAEDVNKTLKMILQDNGVQDVEMEIYSLKKNQRYHEDIFGITLRTAEVTNKGRSDAMVKRSLSNSN